MATETELTLKMAYMEHFLAIFYQPMRLESKLGFIFISVVKVISGQVFSDSHMWSCAGLKLTTSELRVM